jgi:hypothetical protein
MSVELVPYVPHPSSHADHRIITRGGFACVCSFEQVELVRVNDELTLAAAKLAAAAIAAEALVSQVDDLTDSVNERAAPEEFAEMCALLVGGANALAPFICLERFCSSTLCRFSAARRRQCSLARYVSPPLVSVVLASHTLHEIHTC